MWSSLRVRLGIIFVGFLLLVVSSVALTAWLVQTQQADATIINLAGRQRMLTQQMTLLALTVPESPELGRTVARFEQTLRALEVGGTALDGHGRVQNLPPTTDPTLRRRLAEVRDRWSEFRAHLQRPPDEEALRREAARFLILLDELVSAYEAQAQVKINRLRLVQFVFLVAAFLLVAWGYAIVRRNIIRPLALLGTASQEIGAGNLRRPLPALPHNELGQLGQTLEAMRAEIAASHDWLEQRVTQRTGEITTAFEFSQEIVRQLEPAQLLRSVAHRACELMQGEAAAVCVLDDHGRNLELVACCGAGSGHIGLRHATGDGVAVSVIQKRETVMTHTHCANCGFLQLFPDTACIVTPMQVGDRPLGALCVVRPPRSFADDEAQVLALLANAAAIALENSRLIEAGKEQAKENASLAERQRLAAELHDNLAQTLGALHLSVDMLGREMAAGEKEKAALLLAQMQANLKNAYAQVRTALTGLQESPPPEAEFVDALQALVAEFEQQTGLPVNLRLPAAEALRLTAVAQKQSLHILREALTNIRRHARASRVEVKAAAGAEGVQFVVADDGIGFDPDQAAGHHHLGLTIMRTRAERSQGQLVIESHPGAGSRLILTFPQPSARLQTAEAV